jgi:hypothetical protein
MTIQTDVVAYDSEGKLALVVEVKNKPGTNREWAAKMRHNLLARGYPNAPFFLLALPDHFYLWRNKGASDDLENPNYDINPFAFLKPYLEKANIQPEKLSGIGFELLVTSWLNELLQTETQSEMLKHDEQHQCLVESGLLDAIKQGRIVSDVAL